MSESNFPGHGGAGKPGSQQEPQGLPDLLDYNPGGLAVLWAEENRRDALFDAMQRKEAYATSGPRMNVRLFAGTDLPAELCDSPNFAESGYANGVPMGGSIVSHGPLQRGTVRVALQAAQDPNGVGLERLQIVKGWVDEQGKTHEKVVDVARSATKHRLDLQTCQVQGQSSAKLCAVWRDPEFDPAESTYYYGRVLDCLLYTSDAADE